MIIASYFIGKIGLTQHGLSAGARLLGAILGFFNGFAIISLLREFAIGRFLPGAPAFAASATPPSQMSIQVVNMPDRSIADTPLVFIVIGLALLLLAIITGWTFDKMKPKRKTPWGYSSPPEKKDDVKELLKKLAS
jgi:hypothetical protein